MPSPDTTEPVLPRCTLPEEELRSIVEEELGPTIKREVQAVAREEMRPYVEQLDETQIKGEEASGTVLTNGRSTVLDWCYLMCFRAQLIIYTHTARQLQREIDCRHHRARGLQRLALNPLAVGLRDLLGLRCTQTWGLRRG
jgi:hypothetical protein